MRSKTVDRLLKSTPKDVKNFVDWYADFVVRMNKLLRKDNKKIHETYKNDEETLQFRHFIIAATFSDNLRTVTRNYGIVRNNFPSASTLEKIIKRFDKNANNIVILSICEVKKEDYETFFDKIPSD